jgi:PAS domain S-box-containing protein
LKKSKETELNYILNAVFQNSIDGIITITSEGIMETINPAAAKLFGYTPEEIIGKNINMLMPEPFHSEHDQYIHNYNTTGNRKIIGIGRDVLGKRKDGSSFPFYLSVSEIQLEDRTIFTGFIHDISTLKEKERELLENRNKLHAVFQTAVDCIILIDEKGIIGMVNSATEKLFGFSEAEMLGQNISMLMPEPDKSAHDGYMMNYLRSGTAKIIGIGREVHAQRKDGSIFPISLGVSEVKLQNGGRLFTGVIHDLSRQKEYEQQIVDLNQKLEQRVIERTEKLSEVVNKLLRSNNQLESEIKERETVEDALRKSQEELESALEKEKQLGELKSRFVSMASHEFRTPLSTILSSAAIIKRYEESEQQEKREKHIGRIKSAVENLTAILNDFLSLSKLEEGKVEQRKEAFEWLSFCEELTEDMHGMLKSGQKIKHIGPQKEVMVHLDKHHLKNVLINLLSNAIKYSGENKTVFCRTTISKEDLIIEIEDQGIGIPKEDQQHLFDRFFRATNASNIQGTGLGLNITKRYIELMKGSITFRSIEGKGTTFIVKIPMGT